MANSLFYFFAALTVLSALAVVFNKNAVAAALCFFISLCSAGVLFVPDANMPNWQNFPGS